MKFLLYDVIVYSDGDNGAATRVGKYTLTATKGGATKYVLDAANTDFSGTYTEVDSTVGGSSIPAGNYCRFRNVRGTSFTVAATGNYGSDGHPRAPLNAIQIVPINVVPVLSAPGYSGGQFQFFLNGATNVNYVIQVSTNLTNWTSFRTNAAPAVITDPGASSYRSRFYRALFQ